MQEKKVKSGKKRSLPNADAEKMEKHENPKKKVKSSEPLVNGAHISGNDLKKLDTSIFQHFTDLTQEDEGGRTQAALKLIQTLQKTKENTENSEKDLAYALKRLIRGCGAATNASRSGFFTALVAFLKTIQEEEISTSTIFDTMQKELHVGSTLANKEDADAVVGKILVCGALLRSGRISQLNSENLEHITNTFLQAARHRSYHTSLSYAFLIEMLEKALSEQQFGVAVWPLLSKELTKPWTKQTFQTVHCIIVAQKKFPLILNAKYFKTQFGGRELLNPESYEHLHRIFWSHNDMQIVTHPAIEAFAVYLANCENLVEFWTQAVETNIATTSKLAEYVTLKIATDILRNLKPEITAKVVLKLLSTNFTKMLLNGLKQIKIKKDETLKAFYDEYMEALVSCSGKIPETDDSQKAAIIRHLQLFPGTFGIEKLTSTRVIHQLINSLGFVGAQEIFLMYKKIFCGTLEKHKDEQITEKYQIFERSNAGYMLQHLLAHKAVQNNKDAHDWRSEQLNFLLTCGIFNVEQKNISKHKEEPFFEPCKKESACSFSKDFGEQCKNMFYNSLQSKLTDLQQERALKLNLMQACDKYMQEKNPNRFLRIKITEQNQNMMLNAWKKVKSFVCSSIADENGKVSKKSKSQAKEENQEKLELVFHVMLLNMALQLFRETEMAASAIDDLVKCMQRTKNQQAPRKKITLDDKKMEKDAEPDWIEVVMDLFLHLLSQNTGALRTSVNNLFPHLCKNLNVSAVHQILSVLDMKDGKNPLSRKDDEDEDEDERSEDEEELKNENENGKGGEDDDEESDGSNDDDGDESEGTDDEEDEGIENYEDEEEDDDDETDEDDADITENDKLRNAISEALIKNSAAINGADRDDDDDMASIDLNEMTEEEGRRLDEALAAAFKAIKKSTSSQGNERKKTKSQRIETTTVMHFRIRVLDLIEIYLEQPEIDLLNHIEIILALYNMLEFCWSEEMKPLQTKVEKVLQKLTATKHSTAKHPTIVEDLKAEDLVNYIRQLAEKKTPSVTFDITNSIKNRCIVFLVNNASRLKHGNQSVLQLFIEYQTEFINTRNPTVNVTLLSEIYKLRLPFIWELALHLAEKTLQMSTRTFRRLQGCELLTILYKNNELQKIDSDAARSHLNKLEKILLTYITELANSWLKPAVRQSHKEFQTLLEMLLQAQRTHVRLMTPEPRVCSADACEKVQNLRRHIRLDSTHTYQRFCSAFKLEVLRNSDVIPTSSAVSGDENHSENDAKETETQSKQIKIKEQIKKKKEGNLDKRKLKKQKKMERMLTASKGINNSFDVNGEDVEESGDDKSE